MIPVRPSDFISHRSKKVITFLLRQGVQQAQPPTKRIEAKISNHQCVFGIEKFVVLEINPRVPHVSYDQNLQPLKQSHENFRRYQARIFLDIQRYLSSTKANIINQHKRKLSWTNLWANGKFLKYRSTQDHQTLLIKDIPLKNPHYSLYWVYCELEIVCGNFSFKDFQGEVHSQWRIVYK